MRVKRANVPDLPDTVSCSGHLLGINKINLTKENTTKKRERRKGIPQTSGCEIKWEWAIVLFWGLCCLPGQKQTKERERPPQSSKAQVEWGTGWGAVKQGTLGEEMEVRFPGYTESQMHVWEGAACCCDIVPWTDGLSVAWNPQIPDPPLEVG